MGLFEMKFTLALVAAVSANRYENMNEDELLVNLSSTLSSALDSEARGDGDAAVAKTETLGERDMLAVAQLVRPWWRWVQGPSLGQEVTDAGLARLAAGCTAIISLDLTLCKQITSKGL